MPSNKKTKKQVQFHRRSLNNEQQKGKKESRTRSGGKDEDENTGIYVEFVDEILPLLDRGLTVQPVQSNNNKFSKECSQLLFSSCTGHFFSLKIIYPCFATMQKSLNFSRKFEISRRFLSYHECYREKFQKTMKKNLDIYSFVI